MDLSFNLDDRLKNGNLGVINTDRLVVSGRAIDDISVGGRNFDAHDLERIADVLHEIKRSNPSKGAQQVKTVRFENGLLKKGKAVVYWERVAREGSGGRLEFFQSPSMARAARKAGTPNGHCTF